MNNRHPFPLRPSGLLLFLAGNLLAGQVFGQSSGLPSAPQPSTCMACGLPMASFDSRRSFGIARALAGSGAAAKTEKNPAKPHSPIMTGPVKQNQKNKKNKKRKYSPTATTGSPGHIYWIVPAFKVNYMHNFEPLTPKEKFQEWLADTYDPLGLAIGAVEAGTLEYSSSDGFCGYGQGWGAYGQCFGSMQLDAVDSSFFGDYLFTVLMHQDPRYFRLGRGSVIKRGLYAISRVFVTYNDSGHNVFYSSALSGTVLAAFVSNLYYPQHDRGIGLTVSRIGIDLGNTALYNGAAEFWPGIDRWVHHHF